MADIWREVWIEEVHHSTGLSGNSLTRNEVERLLADGKAVGSRLLVEYLYVQGYGDASRWVCQQGSGPKSLVTLEEICFLHEQTTRLARAAAHDITTSSPRGIQTGAQQGGIRSLAGTASPLPTGRIQTGIQQGGIRMEDESNPTQTSHERSGRFREHELQASAEGITPVSWRFVPAEMEKWLAQANEFVVAEALAVLAKQQAAQKLSEAQAIQEMPEAQAIQELAEAVARSHSRFVKTQPFADANGLVARLAANLLLVRRGLPPAIIQKRQRSAYQQALQRADLGNFAQLADLFAQGIFRSFAWFAQPEHEEGLMPLSALETEEINVAALRVAAARGRLRAKRPPGGRWLSTSEWVADYIATRHRRQ